MENKEAGKLQKKIESDIKKLTVMNADLYLNAEPITVTASFCKRSSGGLHDFYSEGDYWWPNPENADAPYIQRDGQSNPGIFSEHRHALIRLSEITATLTSAWILTNKDEYAEKAVSHFKAWFVDEATMMNPHMLYAQAISGRFTGRGIGLIDAYHFIEVVQSAKILEENNFLQDGQTQKIKEWFSQFLYWMTTHQYGIDEMNAANNHGTCWVATAGSIADFVGNQEILDLCIYRFKTILLPGQMALDGSFPRELKRTKPYGYSLFNMDAFANAAQILSTPDENLWEYETSDGKSLKKGMEYIFPFILDKSLWPFEKDIFIWDEWPARHSCLLFAGLAYNEPEYIKKYLAIDTNPKHPEVIRNLPVRHPALWIRQK